MNESADTLQGWSKRLEVSRWSHEESPDLDR